MHDPLDTLPMRLLSFSPDERDGLSPVIYGTEGRARYQSPPRVFEEQTGFTGFSARWRMPEGRDEASVQMRLPTSIALRLEDACEEPGRTEGFRTAARTAQAALDTESKAVHAALWRQLREENPGLDAVRPKTPDDVADAVWGAVSQFPVRDIQFFITHPYDKKGSWRLHPDYAHTDAFKAGWVLSPESFALLRAQAAARGIKLDTRFSDHEGKIAALMTAGGASLLAASVHFHPHLPQALQPFIPVMHGGVRPVALLGAPIAMAGSFLGIDRLRGGRDVKSVEAEAFSDRLMRSGPRAAQDNTEPAGGHGR